MDTEVRKQAEGVLRHICLGAQVCGVRFAPSFIVLLGHFDAPAPVAYDDILLTIETRWNVFSRLPERAPDQEDDLPDLPLSVHLSALAQLKGQHIVNVALGERSPHLLLTFDAGDILFVNGYHAQFECWQLGLSGTSNDADWLVVAMPRGEIALWAPQA